MKILVCISKTPDTTAKIAFTDNNTKFSEAGVQFILNPYDEWYALVRAIELKEADPSVVLHLSRRRRTAAKENPANTKANCDAFAGS